jgi:hypothetical protein
MKDRRGDRLAAQEEERDAKLDVVLAALVAGGAILLAL